MMTCWQSGLRPIHNNANCTPIDITFPVLCVVAESIVLVIVLARQVDVLILLTIITSIIDDAVVYTQYRFTDPSKGLLVVWVVVTTLALCDKHIWTVVVYMVVLSITLAYEVEMFVYPSLALFLGSRGMLPIAMCFFVLSVDRVLVSDFVIIEHGLSALKLVLGVAMAMRDYRL